MPNSRSKEKAGPQVDNATSTQPARPSRRSPRSQTPPNQNSSSENHGHFPAAPHTYPLPPPEPELPGGTLLGPSHEQLNQDIPQPEASSQDPEPMSNPVVPPKRRLPGAAAPPPTKRKRTKQKTPAVSLSEVLQGIGPVVCQEVPHTLPSSTNISPADTQRSAEPQSVPTNYVISPCWEHVYPLDSNTIPTVRPIIDRPPLRARPTSEYLGCRICNQPLGNKNNPFGWQTWINKNGVVSNIQCHLRSRHPRVLPEPQISTSSTQNPGEQAEFNLETFVDKMVTWIIADDQALHVVDSKLFRDMIAAANPSITDKDIPHRTAISKQVLKRYKHERVGLREKLKNALGRISLTTDLWSDSNLTSFMAVTLHWIARTDDGELELKTALGGFRWVKNKHSGENIAARLLEILDELDMVDRVGGITMDNAQNNDTAMDHLEQILTARGVHFTRQEQRIRCFAHVLNLAVQDALAQLLLPDAFKPEDLHDFPRDLRLKWDEGKEDTTYTAALKSDLHQEVGIILCHTLSPLVILQGRQSMTELSS